MSLDCTLQDALGIKSLEEGLVQRHNESAPGHQQILPGHFVTAINHCANDKDLMIKEMLSAKSLTLSVAPRMTFHATLVKNPDLGLNLGHFPGGAVLLVQELFQGGACTAHNAKAPFDHQIRTGDLIEEVNGLKGDASAMMQEVKAKVELSVIVARPCR